MPWLKNYPDGVPTTIHWFNYHNIQKFIDEGFKDKEDCPDDPAFIQMGTALSYR
jgi:hypothetical protein